MKKIFRWLKELAILKQFRKTDFRPLPTEANVELVELSEERGVFYCLTFIAGVPFYMLSLDKRVGEANNVLSLYPYKHYTIEQAIDCYMNICYMNIILPPASPIRL